MEYLAAGRAVVSLELPGRPGVRRAQWCRGNGARRRRTVGAGDDRTARSRARRRARSRGTTVRRAKPFLGFGDRADAAAVRVAGAGRLAGGAAPLFSGDRRVQRCRDRGFRGRLGARPDPARPRGDRGRRRVERPNKRRRRGDRRSAGALDTPG